jgi:hypothetical protein
MARSKLTDEIVLTIFEFIAKGSTDDKACEAAGIQPATFYRWVKRGEKAKSGKYCVFCENLKRARVKAYQRHLALIERAAKGKTAIKTKRVTTHPDGKKTVVEETKELAPSWQASAWLLERRFPKDFSRNRDLLDTEENKPLPWSDDGFEMPDPLGEW